MIKFRPNWLVLALFCVVHYPTSGFASKIIEILPVTEQILMVHFDDGYLDYSLHDYVGGSGRDVKIINNPLDLEQALLKKSYRLFSQQDENYASGLHPVDIGRKSKTEGMPNWPPHTYIYEHWVYLKLPRPLRRNATYTLKLENLAENENEYSFRFDEFSLRSETIHVNQVGYAPDAPLKIAYLFHYMGSLGSLDLTFWEGKPFHLTDLTSQTIVYTGTVKAGRKNAPDNLQGSYWINSDVWECDFSGFNQTGAYQLVVEGIGASFPFRVAADIYKRPYVTALRGLYHQRSGAARKEPYSRWAKSEDHLPGRNGHQVFYSNFRLMDLEKDDNVFEKISQHKTNQPMPNAWGGWFRAGDFDRNMENLLAVNLLLFTFEFNPHAFKDGDLNIPESGNGVPDILDELRYEIDFFLRLKGPTGGISGGLETSGDPVSHPSYDDPFKEWYQFAEEPFVSFWTAAVSAQLSHCLTLANQKKLGAEYLKEAEKIYAWAEKNPTSTNLQITRIKMRDVRMLAAAWLFKTTGKPTYLEQFKADNQIHDVKTSPYVFNKYDQRLAAFTYITTQQARTDTALQNLMENVVLRFAQNYIQAAERRTLRIATQWDFPAVVGGVTSPRLFLLIVAHHLVRNADEAKLFLQYLYTSADYYLGTNPLNMPWMTGIGQRQIKELFNLDSWYDGNTEPIPGLVPYGPQARKYLLGWDGSGFIGDHYLSCFPNWEEWPLAELWFDSRYPKESANYNISQTIGYTAALYCYLYSLSVDSSSVVSQ